MRSFLVIFSSSMFLTIHNTINLKNTLNKYLTTVSEYFSVDLKNIR